MAVYIKDVPNSGGNFQKHGYFSVFTAAAATENMSGFILLPSQSFASLPNQLTHCRQVPSFGIKYLDRFTLYIHTRR